MTPKEVRDLMAFVLHSWPTVPWKNDDMRPLIKTWHMLLADIDVNEATALLIDIARSGASFPPPPGTIAKMVLDMRDEIAGSRAPDADEAWAEIMRGISRNGYTNGQPAWSHPAVAAVVSALTWRELCMTTNTDTMRAHFLRMYDTAAKRVVRSERTVARAILDSPRRIGELPTA